ncbi:MAG: MarR family winged helix-turn-helix transcriptional regulator, partial [Armatimonadota bacterium]
MQAQTATKDSPEYAELIANVFVESVRKATISAMCCEYGGEDITPSLMQCMEYVYLRGASPMREIASGLGVSVSAVSQLVDRLVKKGLMTRQENELDRRLTQVELSPSGKLLVSEMRRRRSGWFESIVKAMPEDERRAFLSGVESFLKIALAQEGDIERTCAR